MKTPDNTPGKPVEKFFFDSNLFDNDEIEEEEPEEDLPPPPPTFSEEELETARKQSFAEGKQQGIKESEESRTEHIAKVLEKISHNTSTLFQAETSRDNTYEVESVRLSFEIFKKLFPVYQENYGFDELKEGISSILKKHEGLKQILIQVNPDAKEGIKKHIYTLELSNATPKFLIKEDKNLTHNACKISWEDGGGIKDTDALAEEIKCLMQQVLAAKAATSHDKKIEIKVEEENNTEDADTMESP